MTGRPSSESESKEEAEEKPQPLEKPAPRFGKIHKDYFDKLYTYETRMLVLDLLRDKYQLRLSDIVGQKPEVVQERSARYHKHLDALMEQWRKEDEERERSAGS